jgi:hypothetical protein
MIGNGAFGVEDTGEGQLMKGVGIGERLSGGFDGREGRRRRVLGQRGTRQREVCRQSLNAVGALLGVRVLEPAVVMQGDRATTGCIRPVAALAMLDIELIIVEAELHNHRFAHQLGVDFVPHAGDADMGVHRHLA